MDKLDTLNLNNNKIEELGPRFFEGVHFSHNRACVDTLDTVDVLDTVAVLDTVDVLDTVVVLSAVEVSNFLSICCRCCLFRDAPGHLLEARLQQDQDYSRRSLLWSRRFVKQLNERTSD